MTVVIFGWSEGVRGVVELALFLRKRVTIERCAPLVLDIPESSDVDFHKMKEEGIDFGVINLRP
ncbi:MAG: hypothetical protein UW07_C0004G0002 [Candidatus Nomurabacteria bacterium GW2011_GWF2_43_8]|uniref:Uncharacterized protein n=2 Tax=Candidatus Nomuraibacteriota TaxID=1752729 RepID=A0A0G1FSF2_9BACT|nr:MAG: hypothetical protein UV76_C0007G0028 [Candidatus Nomurabacteria bacterium GW2011_GWA2_43_15]KKT25003.1 MAG: hypothetical protein UW07_C0004G0002 [Candidatus Nomurabacteria bacterium GW2011_GWF2_43_8]